MLNKQELEIPQNIRTENIIVRLTPLEKATIISEAQKAGISISAFIRLLLRNWADGITFQKKNNE